MGGKGGAMEGGKRASVLNFLSHTHKHILTRVFLLCIWHLQLNRLLQDYPSVGHVAETLRQKNIQIIFAVTEEVTHLYEVQQSLYSFSVQQLYSNSTVISALRCMERISPFSHFYGGDIGYIYIY